MKDALLYKLWGGWFIVCALLGFIPQAEGFGRFVLALCAVTFFVPGGILLYRGIQKNNLGRLLVIRNLSLIWLSTALIMLVLNFLSVTGSQATGESLYGFMIILTSPMVCGQYWIISLGGWAILLSTSVSFIRKMRKNSR